MTAWGEAQAYFRAHVDDVTDDCILWPFATNGEGYGNLRMDGRNQSVHVVACVRHHGPRPPGMFAIHLAVVCHNPGCFNWRHLRWGTHYENMGDRILDGTSPTGERSGHTKLTWDQVRELRARYAAGGIEQQVLAAEYGIAISTISQIITQHTWKEVE